MLGEIFCANRLERTRTHMQGQPGEQHALLLQLIQQPD
jgi:hypothetical protein